MQVALWGHDALLECVLIISHEVTDFEITSVQWKKYPADDSDPLALNFSSGETSSSGGYSFAEPNWNSSTKNVSLLISKAAAQHEGHYECTVETSAGNPPASKLIAFDVTGELFP